MGKYYEVLESYIVPDDPNLIAIEAAIASNIDASTPASRKVKTNLNRLAEAKSSGDENKVREVKREVDESINEIKKEINEEKDPDKKSALRKVISTANEIAVAIIVGKAIHRIGKKMIKKIL